MKEKKAKKEKAETKFFGLQIPKKTYDEIDQQAIAESCSMSRLVRIALNVQWGGKQ